MIRFRARNGMIQYAFIPSKWPCRFGLHFLHKDFLRDRFTCCCGRNFLNCEDIRW